MKSPCTLLIALSLPLVSACGIQSLGELVNNSNHLLEIREYRGHPTADTLWLVPETALELPYDLHGVPLEPGEAADTLVILTHAGNSRTSPILDSEFFPPPHGDSQKGVLIYPTTGQRFYSYRWYVDYTGGLQGRRKK